VGDVVEAEWTEGEATAERLAGTLTQALARQE